MADDYSDDEWDDTPRKEEEEEEEEKEDAEGTEQKNQPPAEETAMAQKSTVIADQEEEEQEEEKEEYKNDAPIREAGTSSSSPSAPTKSHSPDNHEPPPRSSTLSPTGVENTRSSSRSGNRLEVDPGADLNRSFSSFAPSPTNPNRDPQKTIASLTAKNEKLRARLKEFSRLLDAKINKKAREDHHQVAMKQGSHAPQLFTTAQKARDGDLRNALKRVDVYKKENEQLKATLESLGTQGRMSELGNAAVAAQRDLEKVTKENRTLVEERRRMIADFEKISAAQDRLPLRITNLTKELHSYKEALKEEKQRFDKAEEAHRKHHEYTCGLEDRYRKLASKKKKRRVSPVKKKRASTVGNGDSGDLNEIPKLRKQVTEAQAALASEQRRAQIIQNKLKKQLAAAKDRVVELEKMAQVQREDAKHIRREQSKQSILQKKKSFRKSKSRSSVQHKSSTSDLNGSLPAVDAPQANEATAEEAAPHTADDDNTLEESNAYEDDFEE